MSISNYAEAKILDKLLRNTDFTVSAVYVSLHTADPGETGASEVSGGAYARTAATFDAASGGATQNTAAITFPEATASWGTVTHIGLWDAATVGNCLWTGALTASRTVSTGVTLTIPIADLDVALD